METLQKLGSQIIKRREFLELTQQDIATITGLSDATVRFIEQGRPGVAIANWIKVADMLGLELQVINKKMSSDKKEM